jgi:hypothetical protein
MNQLSLRNNQLKLEAYFKRITNHFRGIYRIYLKLMKAKPEDVNMYPVGFRITRILTDHAQKLLGHCFKGPSNLQLRGASHYGRRSRGS